MNFSKCTSYDLERLDMSGNMITGTLPYWLAEFENIRVLNLGNNILLGQIPDWIGSLSFLQTLYLARNLLNGTIPSSLGGLSSLHELDLSHNFLEGTVPSFHGTLCSLTELDLSNNRLSKIPDSFGCRTLYYIDLSSNILEGSLSNYHLDNLSSLDTLDLSFNSILNLNFSSDWKPSFQLTHFLMRASGIQGHLPQWIQTQKQLYGLDLSNNEVSGQMPEWSRNLDLHYLNLSYNNFTGPITHFPSKLVTIDLSHNLLSGPIPQDHSTFNGLVQNSLCHLRTLTFLDLQNNELSGTIPDCWGYSDVLNLINLSFNKLSGVIPMTIGLLPNIEYLNLNSNSLEGEIPPTLRNCKSLVILDLGENKLSGEIPMFRVGSYSLEILRLRENLLGGFIPRQLCSLANLQILDLARNNLTGSIPQCFGPFGHEYIPTPATSMPPENMYPPTSTPSMDLNSPPAQGPTATPYPDEENTVEVMKGEELQYTRNLQFVVNLDLSCNGLVGSIPEELMNQVRFIGLNLSYNHLTGRIPEKIGQMRSLESLDLSNNNLSGTIPSSISALTFLTRLNLSYNNLHGPIPTGSQLQTLEDPSMIYVRNPGLCGDTLPNKCEKPNALTNMVPGGNEEEEDEDNREKVLFYVVVFLGFATGFWGVVGVLFLRKTWRYALFEFVDDMMDYLYVQVVVRIKRLRN